MTTGSNVNEASRVIAFIEKFCTLSGSFLGRRFRLKDWQKRVIADIYAPGIETRLRRRYLLGVPRKNGKTQLAAALALYHLFADPYDTAPVVVSAAGDRQQAKLVFNEAKRMVLTSPALRRHARVFRDHILCTRTGGKYLAASADAALQQGLNPSFVVFDEVHVFKNSELIEALTLGSAMRRSPLFLFISTAGYDEFSPLGELYAYGRKVESGEVDDPAFGFCWYGPTDDEEFDPGDPAVWRRFNPLFDLMSLEDFATAFRLTHVNAFIRYRLNGWTAASTSFLPLGAWGRLAAPGDPLQPGDAIALGFDGAWKGDSTALVATRLADMRQFVLGHWEAPHGAEDWQTPVAEVEDAWRQAFTTHKVVAAVADPWRFEQSLSKLRDEGFEILDFPTNSPSRIIPATQGFYEAVMNESISHDGDPRLARHLNNAVPREDARGIRITKESKNSKKKIDLAIAAIISFWAATHYEEPEPVKEAEAILL